MVTDSTSTNIATVTGANAVKVDGSAVTQPVSGTVAVTQSTSPWVTSRNWTLSNGTDSIAAVQSGTWTVRTQDGAGNSLASSTTTPAGTEQALIVRNIPSGTQAVSGTVAATQSGTWTVQPGNTANTTAWKVDGSAVTQPVSSTTLSTAANQATEITSLQLLDDVPAGMNAAFSKGNPAMGQFDDTSTTPATEDNVAPVRITAQRAFHVNLRKANGNDFGTSSDPVRIDPTGSTVQPVSGTVAATQSGTWTVQPGNTANSTAWYVKDDAQGTVAAGTAGTKSELAGGVYNSSSPSLTTGQQAALQLNSSAALIVDGSQSAAIPTINRTDVSTTVSASSNSSTFESSGFTNRNSVFNVTAISGTGASIQFHIQTSDDATNWVTYSDTVRLTATGSTVYRSFRQSARYYRYTWNVLGTTPSVTFNIVTTLKSGVPSQKSKRFFYSDLDLTVNGNMSSTFDTEGCGGVSTIFMRGADGGNNGTIQLFGSIDGVTWVSQSGNLAANVSSTNSAAIVGASLPFYNLQVTAHTTAGTRVLDIQWSCDAL